MTAAGQRWVAMIRAHQEQTQRLRDPAWETGTDFQSSFVESFRVGRGRRDNAAVVDAIRPHLHAGDTFVDVGAGAGRFALPLAEIVREVFAVEPSPVMGAALTVDARKRGVSNISLVPARWQELPDLEGDVLSRLRRRLYVVPGSEADDRMRAAMQELLEERDGVYVVRGVETIELGLTRWHTNR